MNRRSFLAGLGAAAMPVAAAGPRPNIVLLVADDLGYGGVSVQGGDIPTPSIDSIARNGVRFTSGYVSCPVCSPTRAGLMTGRYQQRFGHEFNPGPASMAEEDFGLPLSEVTLAERLKKLGYTTAMFGKWHLGYARKFLPKQRGFDEFFGFPGGAHSYMGSDRTGRNPVMRGNLEAAETEYLTDALAREAVAFVARQKGSPAPYFLYVPFNAVHTPMEAPAKYLDRFAGISNVRRRTHAAMLTALDSSVGRVLGAIRAAGQEENTLIFFLSDNGGPTPQNTSSNLPLRGYKAQVWEGGIRVPFFVQWKGKLKPGVVNHPAIALDIHPTAVAAAGGTNPANLDGVDLLPYLRGENKTIPHSTLYWRFGAQAAIRRGDFKMVRGPGSATPELYDLRNDIGEARNLAGAQPEKVRELEQAWSAWSGQMAEPAWNRARQKKRKKV